MIDLPNTKRRNSSANVLSGISSPSDALMGVLEDHLLTPLSKGMARQLAPTGFISAKLQDEASLLSSHVLCLVGPYKHGGCTSRTAMNGYLLAKTLQEELRKSLVRTLLGEVAREPFTIANRPPHSQRDAMVSTMNAAIFSAMVEFCCQEEIAMVNRMLAFYGPVKGDSVFNADRVICPQLFGLCLARALERHGWLYPTSALMLLMGVIVSRNLKQLLTSLAVELGQSLLRQTVPRAGTP